MKTAQELRVGNVVMINNTPMVILKSEYSKGGRGASTVKLKMKNLLSNGGTETVYRADDRFEDIILDKKRKFLTLTSAILFMFGWTTNTTSTKLKLKLMEDVLKYLEDGMKAEVVLYNGRPISIELPTILVREVVYTEPAVKGDTSGKVMKPAKLATGHIVQVPAFVNTGDKIEIDTRTDEYRSRVM